ncbi:hypothetical protein ACIOFV_14855 [Streptomyces mirabilis]|uniref:hypothetical protein n=1 Tax=Streptomyces mirabilis TaxID=68239 RepID=UPI00380A0674
MATEPESAEPQPELNNCPEDDVLTDLSTGEGVVYGSLPGSGGGGRSHSVADVMFGRLPR